MRDIPIPNSNDQKYAITSKEINKFFFKKKKIEGHTRPCMFKFLYLSLVVMHWGNRLKIKSLCRIILDTMMTR